MAWFRRKAAGKHALGAAVTSIPSGPLTVMPASLPAPAPAGSTAEPDVKSSIAELLASGQVWAERDAAVAVPARPPAPPSVTSVASGPRVQLGFRDGTSTALDPASGQSLALEELAKSLTRRD